MGRHRVRIAHDLSLVTHSLHGWKAFPTHAALTYTMITWALLPMVPQVPGVTLGSSCIHGVLSIFHGEVHDTHPHQTEWMPSLTILMVNTQFLSCHPLWWSNEFTLRRNSHNAFSKLAKT
jgi:hypothetical protein